MRPNSRDLDQNALETRPGLTTLNRVFPEDSAFLTPPATPPFLINIESALEIPLFLTF